MARSKVLSKGDRQMLQRFALDSITVDPKLQVAFQKAKEQLRKAALAETKKRFPEADMKVLLKYDAACEQDSVEIAFGQAQNGYASVQLGEAMMLPDMGYRSAVLQPTPRLIAAMDKFNKANHELSKPVKQAEQDFRALLATCRTFDQAVKGWPQFEKMRDTIAPATAMVAISPESAQRISSYKIKKEAKGE